MPEHVHLLISEPCAKGVEDLRAFRFTACRCADLLAAAVLWFQCVEQQDSEGEIAI